MFRWKGIMFQWKWLGLFNTLQQINQLLVGIDLAEQTGVKQSSRRGKGFDEKQSGRRVSSNQTCIFIFQSVPKYPSSYTEYYIWNNTTNNQTWNLSLKVFLDIIVDIMYMKHYQNHNFIVDIMSTRYNHKIMDMLYIMY